jgi:hypothetical protein
MSRSSNEPSNENIKARRLYIGYDVAKVPLRKQSKYSADMLTIPTVVAEVEDGDRDPRIDQDLEGS